MTDIPSPISKLKKYSNARPDISDAFYHVQYLPTAEDRVAAIIETILLETTLEDILRTKLIPLSQTDYNGIFGPERPLSTFSARIRFGYALGLYGKSTRKDLDTVRHIRNAFAHSRKRLSFDTEVIAAACELLTATNRTPNLKEFAGIELPLDTPRKKFLASTRLLYEALSRIHFPGLRKMGPKPTPLD
jgi:hypothetical protein